MCRRHAVHRAKHPDVFPVITLEVDSYQHKDPKLGRVKVPVLAPAGYVPKTDFLAALAAAGFASAATMQNDEEAIADDDDDFNDEVSF